MTGKLTAEEREVYPTYVRHVFIWVIIAMIVGAVFDRDGWLIVSGLLLAGDGLSWWAERRRHG